MDSSAWVLFTFILQPSCTHTLNATLLFDPLSFIIQFLITFMATDTSYSIGFPGSTDYYAILLAFLFIAQPHSHSGCRSSWANAQLLSNLGHSNSWQAAYCKLMKFGFATVNLWILNAFILHFRSSQNCEYN